MSKMIKLSTGSLAVLAARHPWTTIMAWLAALFVSIVLMANLLGGSLTHEVKFTRPQESQQGLDLLEERLTGPAKVREMVIVSSGAYAVDDPAFRDKVDGLTRSIMALGSGAVEGAISYYTTGDPSLVSADRHTTLVPVVMAGDLNNAQQNITKLREVMDGEASSGFRIASTGEAGSGKDMSEVSERDLQKAEFLGIPVAMIILVIVFGTLVAGGLPLILAAFSIIAALGMTAILGARFELSIFVVNMITMMGMAVGIDYSLFVVSRFREELAAGRDRREAIRVAGATASRSVLFSGMTVILALAGLFIVPSSIFYSLAIGAILVVVASVIATLTLLPAVLSLIGGRINSMRVPLVGRMSMSTGAGRRGGFWNRVAYMVMRRPLLSALMAAALLLIPASGYLDINTGANGIKAMPEDLPSRQGFEILERESSYGMLAPVEVVIDGDIGSPGVAAAVEELKSAAAADQAFFGEPRLEPNAGNDLARLILPVKGAPNSESATQAVSRLRHDCVPAAFDGTGAQVLVTGQPAINLDYFQTTDSSRLPVFAFVLGLSFLLLLAVFRSLVVPLKAIIMNLLSVGAAYGLIVIVFQKGWGAGLLGFQQVSAVEAWVPLFLFSVLFGLSMDYHVFLLSRIRERFLKTADNTESVAFGLRSTGSIITGAALIMVAVFGGFAAGDLVMFQQMGFGLAVAVLLDATIVRSVLVPATMKLLGKRNWYLPRWLEWLPDFTVEEERGGLECGAAAVAAVDEANVDSREDCKSEGAAEPVTESL